MDVISKELKEDKIRELANETKEASEEWDKCMKARELIALLEKYPELDVYVSINPGSGDVAVKKLLDVGRASLAAASQGLDRFILMA